MAMSKVKDIVVSVRKYQDREGNTKNQWANVGSLMRGDDGNEFILLDRHFNPAGIANPDNRNNVLLSMFDAKPREDQGRRDDSPAQTRENGQGRSQRSDMDEEIPF